MGWRKVVHRLTGRCMGRVMNLSKGEVRIEVATGCDGETLCGAVLYRFGEMVEKFHGQPAEVAATIREWVARGP